MRITREQSFDRHDHPRGAVAALERLMLEKCLLHRVEFAALRQPFDRGNLLTLGVGGEHETRAHGPAIDQHGAGTAHANAAALDRTFEREIVSQELEQGLIRSNRNLLWLSVDRGRNGDLQLTFFPWPR